MKANVNDKCKNQEQKHVSNVSFSKLLAVHSHLIGRGIICCILLQCVAFTACLVMDTIQGHIRRKN